MGVDPRARFEELYRQHAGAVRAYARRRMSAAVADDLVADVFLVAWRRLDEVPAQPLPWLLGVARRVVANRHRGEMRRLALARRLAASRGVAGDASPVAVDRDSEVMRAVRSLSERDRETLMLIGWDGLENQEAAAVLGIAPGVFAVRLHRARRRLARALASETVSEVEVSK